MHRAFRTALAILLMSAGLALAACVRPPTPPAPTIEVTTTADVVADDDVTSLREAFTRANTTSGDDTIRFAVAATYDLTDCDGGALTHATGSVLTVEGDGAAKLTIRQTCTDTGIVRSTLIGSSLVFRSVHLVGGPNSGVPVAGAGIDAAGSLTLDSAEVSGVDAGPGGTVVEGNNGGPAPVDIALESSGIHGNTGTGLHIRDGAVSISGSAVSENVGDGIRLDGASTVAFDYGSASGNTGWGVHGNGAGELRVGMTRGDISNNGSGGVYCAGCDVSIGRASITGNGATAAPGTGGGIVFLVNHDTPGSRNTLSVGTGNVTANRAQRAGAGIYVGRTETAHPDATTTTVLSRLTVNENTTVGDGQHGGGVAVTVGSLSIVDSDILSNVAGGTDSDGGGVHFVSDPTGSGFSSAASDYAGNRAGGSGGGAHLAGNGAAGPASAVTITGSTFSANTAPGDGGGLAAEAVHRLELVDSTVTGNGAARGGGISVAGDPTNEPASLRHVTLAGNRAPSGANLAASGGPVETFASLVVEPLGGANCVGGVSSQGYSFVSDASCGAHPTDTISAADPQLGPLASNGGETRTRLPASTSPILDLVPADGCPSGYDQRLWFRTEGAPCEPGSVEVA